MTTRTRQLSSPHPALWLGAMLLAGVTLVFFAQWALRSGFAWPCAIRQLTGLPCPTCGATRALAALASLDPFTAFRLNPLLTAATFATLALPFFWTTLKNAGRAFWISLGILAGVNWIYLCLFLPR